MRNIAKKNHITFSKKLNLVLNLASIKHEIDGFYETIDVIFMMNN